MKGYKGMKSRRSEELAQHPVNKETFVYLGRGLARNE